MTSYWLKWNMKSNIKWPSHDCPGPRYKIDTRYAKQWAAEAAVHAILLLWWPGRRCHRPVSCWNYSDCFYSSPAQSCSCYTANFGKVHIQSLQYLDRWMYLQQLQSPCDLQWCTHRCPRSRALVLLVPWQLMGCCYRSAECRVPASPPASWQCGPGWAASAAISWVSLTTGPGSPMAPPCRCPMITHYLHVVITAAPAAGGVHSRT